MLSRKNIAGKGFFLALAFLALMAVAKAQAQEPCSPRSEWEIPGVVKDVATHTSGAQDWKIPAAQVSQIVAQARPLIDLLLRLDYLSHPKGLQVGYYRAVGSPTPEHMTLKTQPYPLHVEAMVFGFQCFDGKVKKRWVDADAGVSIDANSLFDILDNTGAAINGKPVYMLQFDLGLHRGHRIFMPYTNDLKDQSRYNRSVLVARPGSSPFTYVTRKELLDYWKAEIERAAPIEEARAASTVTIRSREVQEAAKKKRIEEIQSYNLGADAKKKRIDRYLADLKTDEQLRDEAVARAKSAFDTMRKRLEALVASFTAEQLQEPAVIPAQTGIHYTRLGDENWKFASPTIDPAENCYPRCNFGQYLVTLNENYFDKKMPLTAFQFFVVTVGSRGLPQDLSPDQKRIREETLAKFDFEALAALLDK